MISLVNQLDVNIKVSSLKDEQKNFKPSMTVDEMIQDAYRTDPKKEGMTLDEINKLIKEALNQ